mgnify:CR=1 FL=1
MTAPFENLEPDWLTVEVALQRILGTAQPLPAISLAPGDGGGRILAEDVASRLTLPPYDNSAMDGYAVRASDLAGATAESPVQLDVVGHAAPGPPVGEVVGPGQAIRITTGGPLPDGADCVVRVEDTDREARPGIVVVLDDRDAGRHVRPAGRDIERGMVVAHAGQLLDPGRIGIVAAAGVAEVFIHPGPAVAVVATGDELAGPHEQERLRSGDAIPDVNGPMIAAAVQASGGTALERRPAPDRLEALVDRIERSMDADVLVTIGGASMGTGDLVKRALDRLDFELDFWRVMMRPGSPFGFGRIPREGRRPLLVASLPGNPSSAFVTFELFVRPLLRRLAGHEKVHRPALDVIAGEELPTHPRYVMFPRVTLAGDDHGRLRARSAGDQTSGLVHTLARADGLAVVHPSELPVKAGDPLRVLHLDRDGGAGASAEWLEPLPGPAA